MFSATLFGQNGIIRGTVIEDSNGEPLFGVTVQIKGTTNGAITDFEGKFEISVAPGQYDLQASFVSFQTVTITGLQVEDGGVTVIDQIRLKEDVALLDEVVVTAEVVKTTEAALLTVKRKSANLVDGISATSFRKIGDSDAASAVKRVTGVSVEGGKYVYVRGLGDRYTKTMLNGLDIPGLDPDRNSLQMDIFPTNLIDNMMVLKTAVAEMPADFTGGVVNIETKDFPDQKILDISLSTTYNPSMHFNSDYLTYNGSSTDWLGYDNGLRDLPPNARMEEIPTPFNPNTTDEEVSSFIRAFDPQLGAIRQTNFMDISGSITYANQLKVRDNSIGFFFSGTYKKSSRYFDDVTYGEFQRPAETDEYELALSTVQDGQLGEYNILLGGLAGLAYKTQNSKFRLTGMHLQNGESRAGKFMVENNGEAVGQSGYIASRDNLEYNQRGLTNIFLNGEHHFGNNTWEVEWKTSPTFSSLEDPDIRNTAFTIGDVNTNFNAGQGGFPQRIWRSLDEFNLANRLDITKDYSWLGNDAKLKFGGSYVFKERDYEILNYSVQFFGSQPSWSGDANDVLTDENLYPNGTLYYSSGNPTPNSNAYSSTVDNFGAYISNEFKFRKLKTVAGLRVENFVQRHTGRDQDFANGDPNGINLENEKVLDSFDFFPSLNLIYELKERQNLRFSYSRTVARPSFKELSFAQIIDPITNRQFNGGLYSIGEWDGNLRETYINNYDVRWELFMDRAQLFSVSAFYKRFNDPLELVRIAVQQTSTEYQPRNVGDGQLMGVELEFRKNLDFISSALSPFSLRGNVTLVKSEIDMTPTEFNARKSFEKDGETVDDTREMAGQAPYLINLGLGYENFQYGLDATLSYNVKGSTLYIVGGGLFPDVYSEPFNSLNFNLNKTFGREQRASLNLNVTNILDDTLEEVYKGFEAQDRPFTRFRPGTSISVGFSYSIFGS
ncbi:MAG: TonB-dependent receptor [Ekhidna sp.]